MDPADADRVRRAFGTARWVVLAIVLFSFGTSLIPAYADWQWYLHDVRFPQVPLTGYGARATLFVAAFVPLLALFWLSLRRAVDAAVAILARPDAPWKAALDLGMPNVKRTTGRTVAILSIGLAFLLALGFSGQTNTFLLAILGASFGTADPVYGIDLGFFVFRLPFLDATVDLILWAVVLALVLNLAVSEGTKAVAKGAKMRFAKEERSSGGGLIAALFLVVAGKAWLQTYSIGLVPHGQFTGAGYALSQGLTGLRLFSIICAVVGIVVLTRLRAGQLNRAVIPGGILAAAVYLVGTVLYPSIVQGAYVGPNRLSVERPFAERALKMTRFAYGLDKIEEREFGQGKGKGVPSLQSLRLWDPEILRQSLVGLQAFRPYYRFSDVDVDRYQLNGRPTMVMLSPRDIDLNGLAPGARNWINERLRYTHGYGIAITKVSATTANGQPSFLARDVPMRSEIPVTQPRIYFSDSRSQQGWPEDEYALVNTNEPELDYDTGAGSGVTHQWTAGRGIPMGNLLNRLVFSITLSDGNLAVSGNITGNSRLLLHRSVLERAHRAFPFLKLDADPYLVIESGRPTWLLDAYTATSQIPYSAMSGQSGNRFNYIRNSVKIAIDAYSGEVRGYATEPNEPILQTYRRIYPGLIRDASEISPALRAHFRYPEDLLRVQGEQLASYHVRDATALLTNSDAWEIAEERDITGMTAPIRPYYVQLELPGEPGEAFYQILPMSPRGRQTMSGWMAGHCDGPDYGRLTLYRFPAGVTIDGPGLVEGNFSSTPEISNINRQYNNEQSEILVGNLLVLPVGDRIVYAESLFLRSRTPGIQAVPRLFRVILASGDRVVVAETPEAALAELLGEPTSTRPTEPKATASTEARTLIAPKALLKLFDEAEAALRKGDFAKYGELQRTLRQRLAELAETP